MATENSVWENKDASLGEILEAWMELHTSLGTSFARGYRDPVTETELAAAEERFGSEFHPDVKTFYRMSDGFQYISPGVGGGYLLPNNSTGIHLREGLEIWEVWSEDELAASYYEHRCKLMTPEVAAIARQFPPRRFMPVISHDPMMLLAYAIECEGPRAGAVFGIGDPGGWVAPSLGELFRRAYRFYEEGRCKVARKSLGLDNDRAEAYYRDRNASGLDSGAGTYTELFLTSEVRNNYDLYSGGW